MDYPGKVITKNQVTPTQTSATGVWTLDDAAAATRNNNWPVAGVPNPISKSLRFNSADTAYLNRTPASASSRTTWTWSGWVKRSGLGSIQPIFMAGAAGTDYTVLLFNSTDTLCFHNVASSANAGRKFSSAVYRDVGAWYHIVAVWDTTNATAGNRMLVYVNGVPLTAFSPDENPSSSQVGQINNNVIHTISKNSTAAVQYIDGYLTEINFIDGQALTPSSFGMTDPVTGVWEPLKYSGTYGTNGFYLNFKDATSTTTLGYDYSGNANNWTTNNFSVTAGAGNDSLTDVPTPWIVYNTTGDVGGVVRGNYCTLNPLDKASDLTVTNGNLNVTSTNVPVDNQVRGTLGVTSGKWYWEVLVNTTSNATMIGITDASNTANTGVFPGSSTITYGYYGNNGNKYNSTNAAYGNTYGAADIVGVALDLDNGKIWFSKNGTWQASGDPAAGTNAAYSSISGTKQPAVGDVGGAASIDVAFNFGQRPFAYTPPSGFLSLCTTNLPASTVLKGGDYFNAVLYTGNGSATNTVTTNFGFTPDLIWNKNRSNSASHALQSSPVSYRYLSSDSTAAESTAQIGSVGDNSYLIGSSNSIWNASSNTYVSWCWKANGAGVTNTSGTITSTVSANTTSGFSIVTYTGTGSAATVGHGLGVTPAMYIVKIRNGANNWVVWHNKLANTTTSYILLDSTAAETTSANIWGSTAATSTTIGVGTAAATNANASTYVAYCFAAISGYSAFGSYTGNGSADGPFVFLGFRPRWVMVKKSSAVDDWVIFDSARDTFNVVNDWLFAQSSNAELTTAGSPDILSNGFKLRSTSGATNASSATFIYMAFAENPFKNALAR